MLCENDMTTVKTATLDGLFCVGCDIDLCCFDKRLNKQNLTEGITFMRTMF